MPHALQRGRILVGALLLTLGTLGAADAQIIVTPTITLVSGLYHYDYSITNNTGADLFALDIAVSPDAAAGTQVIRNLAAPVGFTTSQDSVLGIVSFLEDTGTFSTTPQNGFMFDSPLAPASSTFTGNLVPSSTSPGPISTQGGRTRAPVTPEPGSLAVFGALAASGLLAVRRKSRRK
jgi:hypothetical protein